MALRLVSRKNLAQQTLGPGLPIPWGPDALRFMLAGHAVMTIVEVATNTRHTYYVRQAEDKQGRLEDRWFVYLLTNPTPNTRHYKYLGCIDDFRQRRTFRTTDGTRKNRGATAESINTIGDTVRWLVDGVYAGNKLQVWQRGMCGHCGLPLTVPSSIATGLGPDCAAQLGVPMKRVNPDLIARLAAMAPVEPTVEAGQAILAGLAGNDPIDHNTEGAPKNEVEDES